MSTPQPNFDLEPLLAESQWLRRLCHGLVRQDADAEDVAQDTWLAALRNRSGVSSPRAWIGSIARRTATRQRRTSVRREDHEWLVEPPQEDFRSAADAAERLELARTLAETLRDLPEPYRGTLYDHYYEGELAAAIAKRQGVPAATVRWRLAQGRKLLRERLCASDGREWAEWSLALAPWGGLGGPALPAASTLPSLGMASVKTNLLGACAGALVAGGAWFLDAPAPEVSLDVEAQAGPTLVTPFSPEAVKNETESPPQSKPEQTNRTAATAAGPDPLFGVIACGRVVDSLGRGLGGVAVTFQSATSSFHSQSDAIGSWSVIDLQPGSYLFRVANPGAITLEERVTVAADAFWRKDVKLSRAPRIPVRFEDREGNPLATDGSNDHVRAMSVAATKEAPSQRIRVSGPLLQDSECGRFLARIQGNHPSTLSDRYQGLLALTTPEPVWASLLYRDVVLESRQLTGHEEQLVFTIPDLLDYHGAVRARVVDRATGAPVTARFSLRHPWGGRSITPRRKGEELIFEDVPPGHMRLVGYGAGLEALDRSVSIDPGKESDLGTIALGPAQTLRVRAVNPDGAPISVFVSAMRADLMAGPYDFQGARTGTTAADGLVSLRGLAAGETVVRAGGWGEHAAVSVLFNSTRGDVLELTLPRGIPVTFSKIDLRQDEYFVLEDAEGAILQSSKDPPMRMCLGLGTYVMRILSDQHERGRHRFRVTEASDRIELPEGL